MRFSIKTPLPGVTTRHVLVLHGDTAFWLKLVDEQVVACHTQQLSPDCLERQAHCPWVESDESAEPIQVELVLDTTLDEVDRVSVEQGNNALVNRYRAFMTLVRLRKDYRRAKVYLLPTGVQSNVAALMHAEITEQWASWLLMLQAKNLFFHRVVTACELAAHWSRHFQDPTLLIMRVADYERHMLVQQGAVLFLRTVLVGKSGNAFEALGSGEIESVNSLVEQSIEYLNTVVAKDADAIAIVRPRSATDTIVEISGVLSVGNNADNPLVASVSVLLSMMLDLEINCHTTLRGIAVETDNDLRVDSRSNRFSAIRKSIVSLWHGVSNYLPINKKLVVDCWSLRSSALRWLSALEPSVRYMQASRRVAWIFNASLVFAILAAGAASAVLINGVASKRQMYADDARQAMINEVAAELYASAAGMSSQPVIAADSLYVADNLLSTVLIMPELLLKEIASAVTAVSGVHVDRLVWAQADGEELYESLTHSLDSVPSQSSVVFNSVNAAVQLELSGRVAGETLQEQQVLLKKFLGELWRVRGARDVHVLESPVDNALSSASDMNSRGRYRVSLVLGNQK